MSLPLSINKRMPKLLPLSLGFSKYAIEFNGIDNYIKVLDNASLNSEQVTISLLVKEYTHEGWSVLIRRTLGLPWGTGEDPYMIGLSNFGNIYTSIRVTGVSGFISGYWDYYLTLHKYSYVTLSYNSIDGVKGYVNGSLIREQDPDGTIDIAATADATIGNFFDGSIDEFTIYNRTLTISEIRRNMREYHNPLREGLVLWLNMEEGTGLTTYDKSGEGNDGSLLNAIPPLWVKNKMWEPRADIGL